MDFQSIMQGYQWAVDAALVFIVMLIFRLFLGLSPIKVFNILWNELKELFALKINAGSLNAFSLVLVFFFGIVLVAAQSANKLFDWLVGMIGVVKAREFSASVDPSTLFIALVVLAALSILSVARHP